ncbi:MAG: gamma-glutamylcyclotransferase family protein [Pseudomonadota bacterium]
MSLLYFAYGSNMLTARLQARCPSAQPVGRAEVKGWSVDFIKPALDGSAKAGLVPQKQAYAQGVLFRLEEGDLPALDRAEAAGKGYDRDNAFEVWSFADDRVQSVVTYLPIQVLDGLQPYDWYHRLCREGARQHDLASSALGWLKRARVTVDPLPDRPARLQALEALRRSGLEA